jgi:hypothetical protein
MSVGEEEQKRNREIVEFTDAVRETLLMHAPECITHVDFESSLRLGVSTGYQGMFEFVDENEQLWVVHVKPSDKLR